jgi:hypothetical protein
MGDYNKLIVNCNLRDVGNVEDFETEVRKRIGSTTSAYHCGGELLEVRPYFGKYSLSLIVQCKYGRGIEDFLEWLKPNVLQGMGPAGAYAIEFTEYSAKPKVYYIDDPERNYAW